MKLLLLIVFFSLTACNPFNPLVKYENAVKGYYNNADELNQLASFSCTLLKSVNDKYTIRYKLDDYSSRDGFFSSFDKKHNIPDWELSVLQAKDEQLQAFSQLDILLATTEYNAIFVSKNRLNECQFSVTLTDNTFMAGGTLISLTFNPEKVREFSGAENQLYSFDSTEKYYYTRHIDNNWHYQLSHVP